MDLKVSIDRFGDSLVDVFQLAALFVIGATIVWSAAHAYIEMMQAGVAKLDEILLLFIYLELGAIVGIYFKTDRLPVLFLLYVAITALTRYLAVDSKELDVATIIAVTASILILTLAVLVLQIAASRFTPRQRACCIPRWMSNPNLPRPERPHDASRVRCEDSTCRRHTVAHLLGNVSGGRL